MIYYIVDFYLLDMFYETCELVRVPLVNEHVGFIEVNQSVREYVSYKVVSVETRTTTNTFKVDLVKCETT